MLAMVASSVEMPVSVSRCLRADRQRSTAESSSGVSATKGLALLSAGEASPAHGTTANKGTAVTM